MGERCQDRRQRRQEGLRHRRHRRHLLPHHGLDPGQRLGRLRIGRHRHPLLLPQIEIAAREILEVGRFGHGPEYTDAGRGLPMAMAGTGRRNEYFNRLQLTA